MWSQLFLCCLVGLAAASDFGWKSNTEYMYKVHGRTLTGLHDIADQYSGVFLKANLIIRPQNEGKLMCKISDAKYAQIHAHLPDGWDSDVTEAKLNYQHLPLSDSPFQVIVKKGVVHDVIVDKEVHNWEANLLKSIVSNIQFDTQGQHVIKSHVNQLPEEDSNNAVFKTMEDTITGRYETLYDITPLPEYIMQSQPWLVPMPQMKGDGEFIEVVKHKNFSRGEERVGYHYGLGSNPEWEPYTNQMGDFFLRSSVSRAVLSGNLKRYTIQSSTTTNKIVLSPTLNSEQKGMVVSHLNLTLSHVQPASAQFHEIQNPQHLESLVYSYDAPFETSYEAKKGLRRQEHEEYEYSSEEEQHQKNSIRYRRSLASEEHEYASPESQDAWTQEQPSMTRAPANPLLPMFIGYKGKCIHQSQQVDAVEIARKIAQQIGQEIQHPHRIIKDKTLARFTILTQLVRTMSEKQMQEVARQLYTNENKQEKLDAWRAYRDAIAECGTGPALLVVQDWILNKKIRSEEAAEILGTVAQSARQPTPEYMRTFYALATKEEVKSQALLNDTAILSFSTLVRKVYVDKMYSHNQYPVNAFGSFRNKQESKQFVAQEFIPYLKQKLNQAVEQADSHKVLVYIRCLGNVAHQHILAVFEPYLEGEKQISQFQRMQMVSAMDNLLQIHPKIARSVLYKLYQNAGELPEIRSLAVFQLMRTNPPASMLQRMAEYTNIDTSEQVNAAVKSVIETAAQLEGQEYTEICENARSALPLLTETEYGLDYSRNHLRNYVVDEMNYLYKQDISLIGSEDSIFPKGFKYYLRSEFGGVKYDIINLKSVVSSIDELTNVFQDQTEIHQQKQQQQTQNFHQAKENKWSSEAISRLLNLQNDEREQLEASLIMQLGSGATRFFTLNNHTIEMLPEVIREIEESLRDGKHIHYTKFINRFDMTISFPTAMSLPFVYTLDTPTVLHMQGKIRATAEPKISSGDKIHKPHTVTAQTEITSLLSTKIEAKLGFITPFDHQHYMSGFVKNVQFNLPVKSEIEIDLKNKQFTAEIQPLEQEKNTPIVHYSTWPFTAKRDILKLEPLTETNTHIVYSEDKPQTELETIVGEKVGMAFRVQYTSEQKFLDYQWFYEQYERHDILSALMAPLVDETLQHTKLNVEYVADKSTARKVKIQMGYEKRYENEQSNESEFTAPEIKKFAHLPQESQARQEQFAKMVAAGVRSADIYVCDMNVKFDGHNKVEYTLTSGVSRSQVDDKARFLFYFKQQSAKPEECKHYEVAVSAKARVPNTNGLDFVYALKFDPTSTADVEVAFGEDLESATKVNLHAKFEKSESRKRFLQSLPRAQECRREMEQGNKHLPACANMTAEANLMDRVYVKLQYNNVDKVMRNATYKLYNALSYLGYNYLDENLVNATGTKDNEVEFRVRFEPDFESVNVTLRTDNMESHFNDVRVNQWAKQVVVVHPVFPVTTRVMGELYELETYRPICVVDKSAINTLDNKTYPAQLEQDWTVMFQYVPSFARQGKQHQKYQQQQEEQQSEQYVILVRESKSQESEKEIKMTIRTPESQGQLLEVDIKPAQVEQPSGSTPCAKVYVNQKQYQYNDKKSTDIEGGLIKVYALPNGEVKVEVRHSFYIIYDGERVKLTVVHDKFRDAARGLCGTYSGEEYDDFLTPKNCIVRDPVEFVRSYGLEAHQNQKHSSECYYDDVVYTNVISDYDAGRTQHKYKQGRHHHSSYSSVNDGCTKHQTRYVVEESENRICFTVRPLPVCKSSCNASNYIKKSVPVHCVQKGGVADLWKSQIEKGASPDFSHKSPNKTLKVEIPESCSKY